MDTYERAGQIAGIRERDVSDGTYETLAVRRAGKVLHVALNRPDRRNGVIALMVGELHACMKKAATDFGIAAVVLSGAGRDFSVGADLKAYADGQGGRTDERAFEVAALLHEMPAVTIAALRGACAGAAFGWISACDFRVAGRSAVFNTAFLDVALPGDMAGPWTLPRLVGATKARELYFLPGKFDAEEAYRIGLLTRLVDDEQVDEEVARMTSRLEAAAPSVLRAMKMNFVAAEHLTLRDYIQVETLRHVAAGRSEDAAEARLAFLEKRPPKYAQE